MDSLVSPIQSCRRDGIKAQPLQHTPAVIEHDQHLTLPHHRAHHVPHDHHARPTALHRTDNDSRTPRPALIRTDDDLGARAGAPAPPMQLRVLVRHEADDQRAADIDDLRRPRVVVRARRRVDAATSAPRLAVVAGADAVDGEEAVLLRLEDGDEFGAADDGDAEHAVAREPVLARDDGRLGPGAATVDGSSHDAVLVVRRVLARVVELQRLAVLGVAEEGFPIAVHGARVGGRGAEVGPVGAVVVGVGDADAEKEVFAR